MMGIALNVFENSCTLREFVQSGFFFLKEGFESLSNSLNQLKKTHQKTTYFTRKRNLTSLNVQISIFQLHTIISQLKHWRSFSMLRSNAWFVGIFNSLTNLRSSQKYDTTQKVYRVSFSDMDWICSRKHNFNVRKCDWFNVNFITFIVVIPF